MTQAHRGLYQLGRHVQPILSANFVVQIREICIFKMLKLIPKKKSWCVVPPRAYEIWFAPMATPTGHLQATYRPPRALATSGLQKVGLQCTQPENSYNSPIKNI